MKITDLAINRKTVFIALILAVTIYVIYVAQSIIFIFLLSFLIAYILDPIVKLMSRFKIHRTLSVAILTLITIALLGVFIAVALPIIINDLINLLRNLPSYVARLFNFMSELFNRFGIAISLDHVQSFIIDKIGIISTYLFNSVSTAVSSIKGAAEVVLNLVLIPVLVFFLLKDLPRFKTFVTEVLDVLKLEKLIKLASEFESIIGRYFRGMFVVGIILSVFYTSALLVIGVNQAILLGVLTGMGGMIPYVGFAIGIVATVIVTAIQFQDFIHILYVVIAFGVVQLLESFLITPKIVGDTLGLSPVVVIISLMIGGAVLGLLGILLALPVAAFVKILIYRNLLKKPIK